MSQHNPIVIVGAARTPMGAFQGGLKDLTAPELGAAAIKADKCASKVRSTAPSDSPSERLRVI